MMTQFCLKFCSSFTTDDQNILKILFHLLNAFTKFHECLFTTIFYNISSVLSDKTVQVPQNRSKKY